jgi:prepilin-type N-terminal cleavage/methylation domain-containing protein
MRPSVLTTGSRYLSLKRGIPVADSHLMASGEDGFTLLELLVVVVILGILTAIALAFNGAARVRGEDATAKSNIRVAAPAFEVYRDDHGGSYSGVTVAQLQSQYSPGIQGIVVLAADATSYCVSSTGGGRSGPFTTTSCA